MTRIQASLLGAFLLTACDQGSATSASPTPGAADQPAVAGAKADAEADTTNDAQPAKPAGSAAQPASGGKLGTLTKTDDIDLAALVHKTPEQVEAVLGAHEDSGSDRVSCVRFVPERVFFGCTQEIRLYGHAAFENIRVEFEDGHAAHVSVTGLPGGGEFEPIAALASVGISLPGEPRVRSETVAGMDGTAAGDAKIWEWGNSSARLLIDGQQQRVRLSVVDGDWARSKVELINNTPLTAEQKARIKQPRTTSDPSAQAPPPEPVN